MTVNCYVINPENIDEYWEHIAPFIAPALEHEHGDLSLQKVYDKIVNKNLLAVVVINETGESKIIYAVQTMELLTTGQGTLCNLVTTSGTEIELWQDVLAEVIEKLARHEKCYAIHTRGRLGWLKKLKRNGYKPIYFIAEKTLSPLEV